MVIKIAIDDHRWYPVCRVLFGNCAPFSSRSDSLSERTANWFGDRKEVVASLGVAVRLRFLFSR